MPIRIQRKRTAGWRMPENTIYVGRGSAWGNPFVVGRDGTVQECIAKYIAEVLPYQHHGKNSTLENFYYSSAQLETIQDRLRGKNLACWCKIDEPCHADWLLKIANEGDK